MAVVTPANINQSWKEEIVKIGELIAKLGEFDPEMRVLVSGYEGGYDDPAKVVQTIAFPRGYESYSGTYDDPPFTTLAEAASNDWYFGEESQRDLLFEAVVIPR